MSTDFQTHKLAISKLNVGVDPAKSISMILCLYSKFSPACISFQHTLPPYLRDYFYWICIDNKKIRTKILSSTSTKITQVPAVIVVHVDKVITSFEGDDITTVVDIVLNSTQPQVQPEVQPVIDTYQTPISHVAQAPVVQHAPQQRPKTKTKINSSQQVSSSRISRPVQGQGHEKMAISSLNNMTPIEPELNTSGELDFIDEFGTADAIGGAGNSQLDDLITELGIKPNSTNKSENVKNKAAEMMAEKEQHDKFMEQQ